jgi:hypothetical protein
MSTLREAAQQALEALKLIDESMPFPVAKHAQAALRAALAQQQEQEPVAWIQPDHLQKARRAPFLCRVEPTKRMSDFVPIYTTPPRREWQSLTEEEIIRLVHGVLEKPINYCEPAAWQLAGGITRAVEAALKEKNHE